MSRRILVVGYGAAAYLVTVVAFVATIAFLANVAGSKGIDDGTVGPAWLAVAVDTALLGLFAVQHSVMARPWFKRGWTRVVPAAVERSTYVLVTGLVVLLMIWLWRPVPAAVWSVETGWLRALIWVAYGFGWTFLLLSTFAIGHADVFGLRQVLARARSVAYTEPKFRMPWAYRLVRHPMMVGFLIAFWATPDMTVGHLLFAGLASAYILIGVRLEEADLRRGLGAAYQRYAREVPRFVPRPSALAGRRTLSLTRDRREAA
jgi:protein-S-isoprenylcysteine O-methyltransferase Ste14